MPELRNRPRVIAHRGISWFEFDCDVLADGTAVVIHDATLDRTTNQTGDYRALATADLAGIDAGSWFGAGFAGEPLPTLHQVVELMNEERLNANLELKHTKGTPSRASNGTGCAGSVPRATTSTSGRSTRWSRRRSSPRPGAEKGPTRRAPAPRCEGPSG